ncbi:putative TetR-family transcriptional regulator [Marmoricola endophyticus]|uniref:TetR-family transcriptional regulator n=1 Tax=Marmoricola endophyticus TaxID=2040280 RepID=A0A917BFF8_9ACTN|nr:TetR/AcrR family transcriptional regulator [Marmoricola endophyticus]GGF41447.1 putative TetR-family transcriptional regulator [Marmoricola endophyticus]
MTVVAGRREQRKAETRGALLSAARTVLAERRTSVSIREITTMAGVGFGSFFNHFETKDALLHAAFTDSVETYAGMLNALCRTIEDPAEAVSAALRLTGRLQRRLPQHFQVLLSGGTLVTLHTTEIGSPFIRRLQAGNESGRFVVPDLDRANLSIGGATLGFVQLLDLRPDLDAAKESDEFTWRTLMTLGVSQVEAQRLVALPLPPIPDWVGE